MPLIISNRIQIPDHEIELVPLRASGPGGQHVNKVSTAVHLRFDIRASSLPEFYKSRLLALSDQRLTRGGILVIKSQGHRSREKNREEAYERLAALIKSAAETPRKRVPTRPTRASKKRRLESKVRRGRLKSTRGKVDV